MSESGAAAVPFAIAGFLAAGVIAFLLTPLAARLATAAGAIDQPDAARRVHRAPVPRGGGLAVALAFLIASIGISLFVTQSRVVPAAYVPPTAELAGLFGGAVLAALLGFVDDRFDVRARWQFVAQIALALLALAAGIRIAFVNNPFEFRGSPLSFVSSQFGSVVHFAEPVAVLVTTLWVVGMINSINFVDGLDGLSSGIGMIAALTLGGISLTAEQNQPYVAILCFVLAGALAGFLPWNFHPARIFVGTTGVFVLGYALAVLSILGTAKIAVALLVLGVPIIDTFWIIVRRVVQGKSPFTADRGHFHHRLLDLGLSHREAVLVIYGICALLAVLSFVLSGTNKVYAFMGIVVGGGLVLYLLTRRSQEALEARSYDEADPALRAASGPRGSRPGPGEVPPGREAQPGVGDALPGVGDARLGARDVRPSVREAQPGVREAQPGSCAGGASGTPGPDSAAHGVAARLPAGDDPLP